MKQLSWRDVFDSEKKLWGFRAYAMKAAEDAGYKYFCWNGRLYSLTDQELGTLQENGLVE